MNSVYSFLLHYLKKTKLFVAVMVFCIIMHAILMRGTQYFMSRIFGLLPEYDQDNTIISSILLYLALFAGFKIADTLLNYVQKYTRSRFMPYFNSLVYRDLFERTHKHSISFFYEEMAGKISSKAKNIAVNVDSILLQLSFGILMPLSGIIVSLSLIFLADVYLGLILFILNTLFTAAVLWIRSKVIPYSQRSARFSTESEGIFVDTVTNSDLVKSFANYFYERRNFYKTLKKAVRAEQTELGKDALYDFSGKALFDLMSLCSIGLIFYFWYAQGLSLADFVLCFTLSNGLLREVEHFSYFAGEYSRSYGKIKDGLELLNLPCTVTDCQDAVALKIRNRSIEIEHMNYHYPQKENLFNDFNLHIKSGEKIGLVGHSGSGKSTLIKLLVRYYDVDSGQIKIGGKNIAKVRQDSLRTHIAVIPQDTALFNRTIMENIRYGNVNATDEEVISAAKQAYADEFIQKLPQGYHSKVGERGVMLSGGERQRIAIARAILKNAPILILDEATSALDSQSEQYIQKSLKKLMKGKTVIAIAHRLSTLKEMDRLVVMNNGKIIEEGSHDELLTRRKAYYNFYQIQSLNK